LNLRAPGTAAAAADYDAEDHLSMLYKNAEPPFSGLLDVLMPFLLPLLAAAAMLGFALWW